MKKLFTLFVIAICFAKITAQSNAVYTIRNNTTNALLDIEALVDAENNAVYLLGRDNTTYNVFLVKMDNNGTIVWQKQLQNNLDTNMTMYVYYEQIVFFNNELYILGSYYGVQLQYFLTKMDLNGSLIWSKILNPVSQGVYHHPSMEVKTNSGITISSANYESIDIFSLNINGATNWIRNFNTNSSATKNPNFDITVTDNGEIIGCAKAESDISLYCMGNDGNMKWAKRVLEMGNSYTHVKSILEINSNKLLICGYRFNGISYCGFYGFIDSTGSFLDFRMVNELTEIKTGILLNDGNILLQGYNINSYDSYITIDALGNVINSYQSILSFTQMNYNCIAETPNNNKYFATGSAIQKLYDFSSFTCLNMVTQPVTLTSDDPGSSPTSGYFAMHTGGTVVDDPNMQLVMSNLQLEVACAQIGIEENNESTITIFPTALHNYESIFVNNNVENTVLDYRILDMN